MGCLVGASQRALFNFSNFLDFLDEKILKIKTVFFVSDILEESYIERKFQNYHFQNIKIKSKSETIIIFLEKMYIRNKNYLL